MSRLLTRSRGEPADTIRFADTSSEVCALWRDARRMESQNSVDEIEKSGTITKIVEMKLQDEERNSSE